MKKLSIEEKAKRYDETIERAKSLLSGNQLGNAWIYKLLPELKESEDERIRRQTLKILNYYRDEEKSEGIITTEIDECIAWLEKQKANEMPERVYLFDYNDAMVTPLEGDTVYVREDAFMKKAENFLEMLGYGFTITDNITHKNYDKEQLIADFRNYMKGE